MKWLLATVVFSACAAAAVSRLVRIARHRRKGGPMMRRRIFGSVGVALGSLGWAAAVAALFLRRSPALDWVLLVLASFISSFMAWTLFRADQQDKSGGGVSERQAAELRRFHRIQAGLDPDGEDEEETQVRTRPTRRPK